MSESAQSATRVWIVGGIAWDTVLHVAVFPTPGHFTPRTRREERPGGSAANVAQAIATTGLETGFVTVLGRDPLGSTLHETLVASGLDHLHIRWIEGETSHVLVLVDGEGDRTVIELAGDERDAIHLDDVPLRAGDIVVFVVWAENYRPDLQRAIDAGCITVVGLGALVDDHVRHADIAFGSHVDVPPGTDPADHLHRFERIVMTNGAEGARQYSADGVIDQPAYPAEVVDTTGAGDAFLAGYIATYARGAREGTDALRIGARWASVMVSMHASVPPPWPRIFALDESRSSST